jgi:VanZ family protein
VKPVLLRELRYPRLWVFGGLCLTLVVAILCLMPTGDGPGVGQLDKVAHLLAFLMLALWFGGIVTRPRHPWIALTLFIFGGLIELAQAWMAWGRQAELLDLGADTFGIAAGLLLALTPAGRWASWLESMLRQTAQ